jgi:hypothetical protein
MSSQQAAASLGADKTMAEDEVAAYLAANPEFFERHPDLVADLRVPHASGGAVSLIEHQVSLLRRQLQTERRRLAHLIARAQDFQDLSARLHSLSLHLIAAQDFEQVETLLRDTLCRELEVQSVTLKLFPLQPDAADPDPAQTRFLAFIDREHSLCGPLDTERNDILFGGQGGAIRSAALIPIRTEGRCGVLAIGSSDPERFGAQMATDLLDRLGEIVGEKLRGLHEADA